MDSIEEGESVGSSGQIAVFLDDRSNPTNLLINGQPYQRPFPVNLGADECVTYEMTAGGQTGAALACFGVILVELEQILGQSTVPTGVATDLSDVSLSFFYNIRDSDDRLVDSVALPPSTAGKGFRFITSRGGGFDVGVAAFVTTPNSTVNITVHLPQQSPGNSVIQGTDALTGSVQILGQRAFFLHEVIPGFPETVSAALVEMELAGSGEIYGVALGVQAEDGNVQLSGQTVNTLNVISGSAPPGSGPFAYVGNSRDHTVSVIDTVSDSVVETIPVGLFPSRLVASLDGTRMYLTGGGGAGYIQVIDTLSNTVTTPITGLGSPVEMAITPNGNRAYVANDTAGNVSIIDVDPDSPDFNTVIHCCPVYFSRYS